MGRVMRFFVVCPGMNWRRRQQSSEIFIL